ncbi:XRE family transcriptional regulator [Fibrella aquatilis]|uniref:LexA family transcriptional regulator n=1 Tax=Fibrella aquatilis TaxID=2817059 RepID=A0A939GCJ1_9BACT|nr:LexA family transcriptional regulator [Fibrella aquatilis]MBO0933888.1 LexA family transcriptional regulator [Fibrella aquatilis]
MQLKRENNSPEYPFGTLLRTLRKANGLTLKQVGAHFNVQHQAVQKWETGISKPKSQDLAKLAQLYKVPVQQLTDAMEGNAPDQEQLGESNAQLVVHTVTNNKLIDLPYVPAQDRSRFSVGEGPSSAFGLLQRMTIIQQPGETYENNLLVEIHNDSMEPYYPNGTIVLAEWEQPSQWPYMPSGVYAIFYNNYFIVRRIVSNDLLQHQQLALHADNPTGGIINVPADQIHHVFRVKHIVYAPAR